MHADMNTLRVLILKQVINIMLICSAFRLSLFLCLLAIGLHARRRLNVGTVLFGKTDILRMCWDTDKLSLLEFREDMQDILPTLLTNNYNDKYIEAFLSYLRNVLEITLDNTEGITGKLMVTALADVVGGYLKSYLIPVTKQAYYSGNVKYREVQKLLKLYEDVKLVLRTDGQSWTGPVRADVRHKIAPLHIVPPNDCPDPCTSFILNEGQESGEPVIPIPFFDNPESPNSVALPIKSAVLYSLHSSESTFLLEKFYVASMRCLYSRKDPEEVCLFNHKIRSWLLSNVIPRLWDDRWYPAFGGVLRIMDNVRQLSNAEVKPECVKKLRRSKSGFGFFNKDNETYTAQEGETTANSLDEEVTTHKPRTRYKRVMAKRQRPLFLLESDSIYNNNTTLL